MMSHRRASERGSLMVVLPISLIVAVGLAVATLSLSTTNLSESNRETKRIRAYYVAKAGIENQIAQIRSLTQNAVLVNAFQGVDSLNLDRTFDDEPLDDGTSVAGTYDVSVRVEGLGVGTMSNSSRFVTIRSTGWVPNKTAPDRVQHTVETTIEVRLRGGSVFDYAYFINHWGWFYGNTIVANGNVRANGQFDLGGYSSTVNGSPRYLGMNGTDLYGYMDDNADDVRDGTDGGIYAGWDIIGSQNVQGMAATADATGAKINQHDFSDQVEMPNISDLAIYEQHAKDTGSNITIGGVQVTDAVCGDDVGEKQNLCLIGTTLNPIVINGTVVVRGALIIKGVVTGHGVIYAGDNVYIADDLTYKTPPTTARPTGPSEAEFETWLNANQSKDTLGLFAREHVVLGDYTHSSTQSYVSGWMNHPSNVSKEDAGADGIPNTRKGLDGILNTADDDVLEGDNVFTVDHYTAEMAALGQIPPGKNVGDVIPGSGEDIDGDGIYDPSTTYAELTPPVAIAPANWAGNMPSGTTAFNQIGTRYIAQFDAALYTNHSLAGYIINSTGPINFNGCIVSRNEDIIYTATQLKMNHDARLIGGGDIFGYYLPRSFDEIRVMKVLDDVGDVHFDEAAAQSN